jgi:hypothetical protein
MGVEELAAPLCEHQHDGKPQHKDQQTYFFIHFVNCCQYNALPMSKQ